LTDTQTQPAGQIQPAGLNRAALESLDDHTLGELHAEVGRILADRCSAELPATVETAVRAALTSQGITGEPVSATFTTTWWDNGYFWNEDSAQVVLADGSTIQLDLDGNDLACELADHSSWEDIAVTGSDAKLIVTFNPADVTVEDD
jgi:hypothetical protein